MKKASKLSTNSRPQSGSNQKRQSNHSSVHPTKSILRSQSLDNVSPSLIIHPEHLVILDLSLNSLTSLLDLGVLPNLRILFAGGNKLVSCDSIPKQLPSLEVLSLSDNTIDSFIGLPNFPSLTTLFISNNHISTFEAFPSFKSLTSLHIQGNPLALAKNADIFAFSLCNRTLMTLDGNKLSSETKDISKKLSNKCIYALRFGIISFTDSPIPTDFNRECEKLLFQKQLTIWNSFPLFNEYKIIRCDLLDNENNSNVFVGKIVSFNISIDYKGRTIYDESENGESESCCFEYSWYHINSNGSCSAIPFETSKSYQIKEEDLGLGLKVQCKISMHPSRNFQLLEELFLPPLFGCSNNVLSRKLISRDEFYSTNPKWKLIVDLECEQTMSWPKNKESCKQIANLVISTGCKGITSIGCGKGIDEWLLAEFFPDKSITGIDLLPISQEQLCLESIDCINYRCAFEGNVLNTPETDAIAFFYPINMDFQIACYLTSYKGSCVIIAPSNVEDEEGTALSKSLLSLSTTWKLIGTIEFETYKSSITVDIFQRINKN